MTLLWNRAQSFSPQKILIAIGVTVKKICVYNQPCDWTARSFHFKNWVLTHSALDNIKMRSDRIFLH